MSPSSFRVYVLAICVHGVEVMCLRGPKAWQTQGFSGGKGFRLLDLEDIMGGNCTIICLTNSMVAM